MAFAYYQIQLSQVSVLYLWITARVTENHSRENYICKLKNMTHGCCMHTKMPSYAILFSLIGYATHRYSVRTRAVHIIYVTNIVRCVGFALLNNWRSFFLPTIWLTRVIFYIIYSVQYIYSLCCSEVSCIFKNSVFTYLIIEINRATFAVDWEM